MGAGVGADAISPEEVTFGCGGHAGHGGGGGGGNGYWYRNGFSMGFAGAGSPASGGKGSNGTDGGDGCIIIYW